MRNINEYNLETNLKPITGPITCPESIICYGHARIIAQWWLDCRLRDCAELGSYYRIIMKTIGVWYQRRICTKTSICKVVIDLIDMQITSWNFLTALFCFLGCGVWGWDGDFNSSQYIDLVYQPVSSELFQWDWKIIWLYSACPEEYE